MAGEGPARAWAIRAAIHANNRLNLPKGVNDRGAEVYAFRREFLKTLATVCGAVSLGNFRQEPQAATRSPVPLRPDDPDTWRAAFPLDPRRAYLNTGGLGAAPQVVLDAVIQSMQERHSIGEHGHGQFEDCYDVIAEFLGCRGKDIALVRNTTEGNSTVTFGLDLQAGDEVVIDSEAHPGGATGWMLRQRHEGIRLRVFRPSAESAEANLAAIQAVCSPRTKVVQISHVTSPRGIRMPVELIANWTRDRGIWLHVDAAQSAGMFPFKLDHLGCQSWATSCHKWMLGPHGTGLLWVDPARLDRLRLYDVGAHSTREYAFPERLKLCDDARRFIAGTQNVSQAHGVVAAIHFLQSIGMRRVWRHGLALGQQLSAALETMEGVELLSPVSDSLQSSLTTFRIPSLDHREVYRQISADGFRVRIVNEDDLQAIRVSTHVYNSEEECEQLLDAVGKLAAKAR